MRTEAGIIKILMNKETGGQSLGIRVQFMDKPHHEVLEKFPGYSVALRKDDPDGWLIFSGEPESSGPWMFVDATIVDEKIEVIGAL